LPIYLHKHGGYFYCDGANFNALVGKIRPGDFGVDVMHINLHKTFSTPHGGGGPGSGPICCTAELAKYMPVPTVIKKGEAYKLETEKDRPETLGRLKGFQGQFGMHVRALAYMMSHGADGLKQVSEDAVLNANYILAQLKDDFHAPFAEQGPCMHECIADRQETERGRRHDAGYGEGAVRARYSPDDGLFPAGGSGCDADRADGNREQGFNGLLY
jgi:glycine dehydrogenase subunit 2